MGIRYESIPVESVFESYLDVLAPHFADSTPNEAEENLQSRARVNILMALNNKFSWIVLITGNKSETAVGYATLYGDMAGGFVVIKDVPKTLVSDLANYRNSISPSIPQNTIDKPPSAELRPDQVDTDSLPHTRFWMTFCKIMWKMISVSPKLSQKATVWKGCNASST